MHDGLDTAESDVEFAVKHYEGLFKIVAMRRRAAARGNMHVNKAEAPVGIVASEQNGVGVTDDTEVRKILIGIRPCNGQNPLKVIGRKL